MRIVKLAEKSVPREEGDSIEMVKTFGGHVLGITRINAGPRPFDAILFADESGDYVAVAVSAGLFDLRRFIESIAGIDLAPYTELAYVGEHAIPSESPGLAGYSVKRVAWRFRKDLDVARSSLRPKSPEDFPPTVSDLLRTT